MSFEHLGAGTDEESVGGRGAAARAEAIDGFAATLARLRESVGTPSFRVLAGRSRAISHTTLHEAVTGNRLPSWGTTVEFVTACGADPGDYRERWERANRAVLAAARGTRPGPVGERSSSHEVAPVPGAATSPAADVPAPDPAEATVPEPPGPADATEATEATEPTEPAEPAEPAVARPSDADRGARAGATTRAARWWRRRTLLPLLAGGVGVVALVALAVRWPSGPASVPVSTTPSPAGALDCPVQQPDPPSAPAAHPGDRAVFVTDVTLPDCTHVRRGATVEKVWRFKNAGSVPWAGYALHRIDEPQGREECQTVSDVPVPTTDPGQMVDVTVQVLAPERPRFCLVRFKMVDADGAMAFPANRPVNLQVVVD